MTLSSTSFWNVREHVPALPVIYRNGFLAHSLSDQVLLGCYAVRLSSLVGFLQITLTPSSKNGDAHTIANRYLVGSPPMMETGTIASVSMESERGARRTSPLSRFPFCFPMSENSAKNGMIVAQVDLMNRTLNSGIDSMAL